MAAGPELAAATERPTTTAIATNIAVLVGAVVAAVLLVVAVVRLTGGFGHGIDITDEGLYLQSADAPGRNYAYVGLWGAYLHPLFALVHYDIAAYRMAGAIVLTLGALVLSAGIRGCLAGGFGRLDHEPVRVTPLARICLDLAIVSGALTYYSIFLLTPSYNWLTLLGVLLAAAGLLPLLGVEQGRLREVTAAVLLAVGCFIALMGRPLCGIGLGVLGTALVLVASPRPFVRRAIPLLMSLVTVVVLGIVHLIFFVGWSDSLAITRRTQYFADNDATGHTFGGLVRQSIHQFAQVPHGVNELAGWSPLLGLLPILALMAPVGRRQRLVGPLGAAAVLLVGLTLWQRNGFSGGPGVYLTLPDAGIALVLTCLLVLLSALVVGLLSRGDEAPRALLVRAARALGAGAFLAAGAVLYAFSSSNGAVNQMWGAFGVLATAGLVLLIGSLGPPHVPIVAASMAVVCGLAACSAIGQGAASGYRTASVAASTVQVQVSSRGATLLVAPRYAHSLETLRTAALDAGFTPGTPLIDLTPFCPGIGYLLGSQPPTTIMLGFSPGVAKWALAQQDPKQWHDAWLLIDANHSRSLPTSVLSTVGRTFPDDYELVASAPWPIKPPELLQLWRPKTT